jgi:acetolactate synthase-1/3 small subunit
MTGSTTAKNRSGHSDIAHEEACEHTLVICVENLPGAVDRVVGALRRRRANTRALTMVERGEQTGRVRITAVVSDSEVGIDHLVEQLRKIVNVERVEVFSNEQTVARELALIKVSCTPDNMQDVIEAGQLFGAHLVDVATETATFEITGRSEKIRRFTEHLQPYGIRDIACSGRVVMARA